MQARAAESDRRLECRKLYEVSSLAVDDMDLRCLVSLPTVKVRPRDSEGVQPLVLFARYDAPNCTPRELLEAMWLREHGTHHSGALIHMLVSKLRPRRRERRFRPEARPVFAAVGLSELPNAYGEELSLVRRKQGKGKECTDRTDGAFDARIRVVAPEESTRLFQILVR